MLFCSSESVKGGAHHLILCLFDLMFDLIFIFVIICMHDLLNKEQIIFLCLLQVLVGNFKSDNGALRNALY